ncbi:MAG: transcriptional regulator, IclR family [Solirubrobacterales bacterium]|nr:transcriptional regulator, IclR family [Solirubrobacterales bacterium]
MAKRARRTASGSGESPAAGPKVLEKTLRVLDLFTIEHPSWSATEVARELEMPTATAHRIVRALEARSYLAKVDTRYRLGFAAIDLGRRATASMDLRARLGSVLRELARTTAETALLTVYDESHHGSLCVDRIETTHSLRLTIEIGRVTPIHAGASAKALLAFLEEPVIEEVLAHDLEPLAPGTVTDPELLRKQLEEIRVRGWASSYEENNVGAWGLAAPILVGGAVVASIGFAAPAARHSDSTVRSLAKLVREAARESEARLDSANMAGGARTEAAAKSG